MFIFSDQSFVFCLFCLHVKPLLMLIMSVYSTLTPALTPYNALCIAGSQYIKNMYLTGQPDIHLSLINTWEKNVYIVWEKRIPKIPTETRKQRNHLPERITKEITFAMCRVIDL